MVFHLFTPGWTGRLRTVSARHRSKPGTERHRAAPVGGRTALSNVLLLAGRTAGPAQVSGTVVARHPSQLAGSHPAPCLDVAQLGVVPKTVSQIGCVTKFSYCVVLVFFLVTIY